MSALVNYGGDDEFFPGGSSYANLMDSSILLSLRSHVDVYFPPRKRSRASVPFIFREDIFEQQKPKQKPSIEVLPDECLFEIFRRLPGGQERSVCACVSKRWLNLVSSVDRTEICCNKNAESLKVDIDLALDKADEASKHIKAPIPVSDDSKSVSGIDDQEIDGCLTRSLEGKKATDIRLAAIAVGTGSRGGLGKLLIRGSNSTRGVTNVGLSVIARGCPSLRVLSLWNVPSIGDEGLIAIAKGCHLLEKLDLSQCPLISDKGLIAIAENCPNLTALTIDSCSNIGNEGLQAIGRRCANLNSIMIKDCPLVGDQGVASLISSASLTLVKVKLQLVNITDVSLAVIGHYGKNITDLSLTGLQNVSERGFWVMGNAQGLQKLKSFTVIFCGGVSDLALEALGKGCPNLKQLCLRMCSFVSDNGLVAFAKSAVSLESLQVEECNSITQSGVLVALSNFGKLKSLNIVKCLSIKDLDSRLALLSPCETLRSLSIRNCPGFGNSSLAMVGKLCPQLQHVDLSGLYGITDAGFLPLLQNCKAGLVKVNLSGCMNLTDAVISTLARLHGETLQLLNLDGCWKITDASLVAISENCPLLHDLDVSKCLITDFGVAALSCAKELELQILSLSGCSMVSDKSMLYLANMGESLVAMNLQHCKSVSSNTIELLMERLWRCDILV